MRQIEIEVLERLLINEETVVSSSSEDVSLQNVSLDIIHRKRSNSVPNTKLCLSNNFQNKVKSASTLSLRTSMNTISNHSKNRITYCDDNLSVNSIESTATTTASVDSFEIALGLYLLHFKDIDIMII